MATFLYRLGRFAFRRRRFVALFWVALLAVAGVGAATAPTPPNDVFSVPGTEAQKAFDLLDLRFPGTKSDGAAARVVFRAPQGQQVTDPANKAVVEKTVTGLRGSSPQVESVADPYQGGAVSKDGSTAYISVGYKVSGTELDDSTKDALKEARDQAQKDSGMAVEVGGDALDEAPSTGSTEIIGIAAAAVVLLITFGGLVAAGMPLLTAIIGVGIGISGIAALASTLGLSDTTSTLATMIGLAVGIDYALFIVSRYRAELAAGREREDAAGRAVGTAGSAVVFAGLTVVIALVGLSVVNIPMLTKMGFAAAATVVIAVLIAVSLIPALLGFAGKRVFGRKARKRLEAGAGRLKAGDGSLEAGGPPEAKADKPNAGTRWARFVLRRPVAVLLVGVVALGAAAVPAAGLELGLPDDGSQPTSSSKRRAYDMISEGFGPGYNGPLNVVVDAKGARDPGAAAEQTRKVISGFGDVASVSVPSFNKAGDTAKMSVTPRSKPSSTKTEDLVSDIRGAAKDIRSDTGAEVLVTGTTAMNIDVSQKLNDALLPYLALVVGLAFLLLMIVFRSVLVPLKAALGFLLSVVAALGAVVAVFQEGWGASLFGVEETGPIMSFMPIFMIGVVFGLAMDYEVFLVTRMREAHVHGERSGEAIVTGFRHGARVVTAAAVIMMSVFSGFIGSSESMVKMIGFGLAIAVFFDAFIVRMAIVPAVLALLGKSAWWLPGWLNKVLPNVDVEGEKLHRQLVGQSADEAGSGPSRDPDADPDAERVRSRV
ncbi:MMPL family transporter [Streptomyces sp. B1866]|uniref:MMPL family transporter n=1 Tax=Streptomyces sp. B1866 TaxID=3075431 RepID=UPI0028902EBD|nr:MMPL family transporter [Streptomyces sp. B1866]MDT3398099.1 MMPL family transporter [Streptomyces sp. B1866]